MTTAERDHHERVDPHVRLRWLSDVVLGGQDGLVNVLGVILGVAAATGETRVVIAAGCAAAFAESISMAAVAYTSKAAAGDLYKSEKERERRHIAAVPEIEREEIRAIYANKGFSGEILERIVHTITSDPEVWLTVMMKEEHALVPFDRRKSLRSAIIVGSSSLVGSFIPLLPFFALRTTLATVASMLISGLTLFGFGVYKAKVTVGRPLKSGLELAGIGITSAIVGFAVGAAFAL